MALDIVLNELSLETPASDRAIARQWMTNLIQTVRSINAQTKSQAILRSYYDFHSTFLTSNYALRQWLNDNSVDREERRFIRSLTTKAPFSEGILESDEVHSIENNIGSCEFRYQGKLAIGLGIAHLLDVISVSVTSASCWDCSYLDLDAISIDEDDAKITIVHASRKEHIQDHVEWIKNHVYGNIDGRDLWNQKEKLFPNLQFCASVEKQLQSLSIGNSMLNPVKNRLLELQKYAENWTEGGFDSNKLACKATPESEATLQQYSQERTFICPDDQKRIFSWHVRLTPLAWRIHFYPEQSRKILIGYIGNHLPTAKFN
ncbi:hypothetical protein V2H45_16035 [Tumidithrix elongata RA019]|uniref:Uncharacterized protein n=1 Tax=Tumidithrix elongata BACA0141 TaxID=2716417 RepID=A0AAW9Q230_9CYAN|nr:hypothetical protein [Tumidithrix elongata RA019]